MTTSPPRRSLHKIVLIGDLSTGKTSFLNNAVQKKPLSPQYRATIGADFFSYYLNVGSGPACLQLWDTAGDDRYKSNNMAFLRGMDALLIFFDITSPTSFYNVKTHYDAAKPLFESNIDQFPVFLIGNKSDLEAGRSVFYSMALELADELNMTYIEISVHDGIMGSPNQPLGTFDDLLVQVADSIGGNGVDGKKSNQLDQHVDVDFEAKRGDGDSGGCNVM